MTVAAITGLVAKENVVGTFGQLFGFAEVAEDGQEIWGTLANSMSQIAAYSFLVFNLLCAPCFAAMGAIKREMNNAKWFWFAIGYQCLLAYLVSLCILPVWYTLHRWRIRYWNSSCNRNSDRFPLHAVPSLQREYIT